MNKLIVTEYQNQRILTTSQLADSYETTGDVITKNFNRNIERYQEGKHFYCLEGEVLKQFKSTTGQIDLSPNLNKLYLWTEKGCLHHAKSLGTDKAWEVFEMLEETYFKVQKVMTQMEIVAASANQLVLLEQKYNSLDSKITNALEVFAKAVEPSWKESMNKTLNGLIESNGLNYQVFKGDLYTELDRMAHVDISSRQTRLRNRMKLQGHTAKECKAISKLDIIDYDPQLRLIFEGIVRKYQAKYAVESVTVCHG